jgi:hypothetical protein
MKGIWIQDAHELVQTGEFHSHGRNDEAEFGHYTHPELEFEVPAIHFDDGEVLLPSDWQAYDNVPLTVSGKPYDLPEEYQKWAQDGLSQPDGEGWRGDEQWLEMWDWRSVYGERTVFLGGLPRILDLSRSLAWLRCG